MRQGCALDLDNVRLTMFRRKILVHANSQPVAAHPARLVRVDIDLSDFAADAGQASPAESGWLESSRDLQNGIRVCETPMESLPLN